MNTVPFFSVEGVIGVGKSSLARRLSQQFGFHTLHEIVEQHPFLADFYRDPAKFALQTEVYFLINRFQQLEEIQKEYLAKGKGVVADYHILKNQIFAGQTLSGAHAAKYEAMYKAMTEGLAMPNLVIYLKASLPTLLHRIQLRDREMERDIDPNYLQRLIVDYDRHMEQLAATGTVPVLVIEADQLDFVQYEADFQTILKQVEQFLPVGSQA